MRVEKAFVGARGIDSLGFSQAGTMVAADALKASGIDFVVGYLGVMNAERVTNTLRAGLGLMMVTLAGAYDGALAAKRCVDLGIPQGVTVWLDLEGRKAFDTPPAQLIAQIDTWASEVSRAGYVPGLYVGSPQPLTSGELYRLKVVRYWNALSRESDRTGALAEPECGWCMWQMSPSVTWAGQWVDVNMIGADFRGRVPTWVRQ